MSAEKYLLWAVVIVLLVNAGVATLGWLRATRRPHHAGWRGWQPGMAQSAQHTHSRA